MMILVIAWIIINNMAKNAGLDPKVFPQWTGLSHATKSLEMSADKSTI